MLRSVKDPFGLLYNLTSYDCCVGDSNRLMSHKIYGSGRVMLA